MRGGRGKVVEGGKAKRGLLISKVKGLEGSGG